MMKRTTRLLVTAAAFAIIALSANARGAAAFASCYACVSVCNLQTIGACYFQCDRMFPIGGCAVDSYEYCGGDDLIIRCTDSPN